MAPLRGKPVVSYHESWEYFARRFGLDLVGQLEPKPGIPPSPSHLARLIGRMKQVGAKLILVEPYYETRNPALVARETGAQVVELPNHPGAGTDSYFGMIDQIVERLATASRSAGSAAR
jgi:ABC-type Zn uptake system ZnuABC Zn-binding protein ZnuA